MSNTLTRPDADDERAQSKAEWVARVLGVSVSRQGGTGSEHAKTSLSLVQLGRARIGWGTTLTACRAEMAAFKGALEAMFDGAEDPDKLVSAALKRLDAAMSELNDTLTDQLDAVLNASEAERPALVAPAQATMRAFRSHLGSDPVLAALDGNEVRPETSITGPLLARLAEIDAAIT